MRISRMGPPTARRFVALETAVDSSGKYDVPSLTVGCDLAIRWRGRPGELYGVAARSSAWLVAKNYRWSSER